MVVPQKTSQEVRALQPGEMVPGKGIVIGEFDLTDARGESLGIKTRWYDAAVELGKPMTFNATAGAVANCNDNGRGGLRLDPARYEAELFEKLKTGEAMGKNVVAPLEVVQTIYTLRNQGEYEHLSDGDLPGKLITIASGTDDAHWQPYGENKKIPHFNEGPIFNVLISSHAPVRFLPPKLSPLCERSLKRRNGRTCSNTLTHRDGAILARYLVTGKKRERAELWELRGFACTGIVAAFRSVHVIAAATKCTAPFFHLSVRNRDEENLDRSQWEYAANLIERMLGLTDQPRAVAFHTAEDTGHSHMHIAWSRINEETLTAKPLPFFKLRLKQLCRELEEKFGLTPVPNERGGAIRFAPTRAEEEQARRLQVDVHPTRETIRNCFERSDCGRSFRDALAQEGFVLARGDRRDFLVVDRAGGMHALGKRILGVSAAEIRDRLADLSGDLLPTLEQARVLIAPKRQVSPDNEAANVYSHAIDRPKPVSEPKRSRPDGGEKTRRTAGKRQPQDQVRRQLATTYSVADKPAPNGSLESENAAVDQPRHETPQPPGDAAQITELQCAITGSQEQTGGDPPRDKPAGPELVTGAAPHFDQPPSVHKTPGHAARLRDQFRALVKQMTAKVLTPRPTSRKRRREEIGGGFRKAALSLRRSAARIPPLNFLDPTWEPFTWLRLWEYNDPPNTDFHNEHGAPMFSNPSLHL